LPIDGYYHEIRFTKDGAEIEVDGTRIKLPAAESH
jgi:hypothetical protein